MAEFPSLDDDIELLHNKKEYSTYKDTLVLKTVDILHKNSFFGNINLK